MTTGDFDLIGKNVYENVEQINRILSKAKFVSKFHASGDGSECLADVPNVLLALAKEDDMDRAMVANVTPHPLERPSEEEIDSLFDAIRSNSGPASRAPQRQGSFKKTTGAPLQHSRILNETNLMANGTVMTGSCSDLSNLSNKTTTQPKQPAVDIEELVSRFRETVDLLAKVENGKIQVIDLAHCRQRVRSEWATVEKICRKVESLLDDSRQKLGCNEDSTAVKQEPIISSDFIKSLKTLLSTLHHTAYIQKSDNLPDLSRMLSKEVFPLSECLDSIEETIRQKQL